MLFSYTISPPFSTKKNNQRIIKKADTMEKKKKPLVVSSQLYINDFDYIAVRKLIADGFFSTAACLANLVLDRYIKKTRIFYSILLIIVICYAFNSLFFIYNLWLYPFISAVILISLITIVVIYCLCKEECVDNICITT